jgi:hypothetical protein
MILVMLPTVFIAAQQIWPYLRDLVQGSLLLAHNPLAILPWQAIVAHRCRESFDSPGVRF